MLVSKLVYGVVASFAALAAAQTTSGTTTSTATMTRTITITTCNPEVSNCPGRTSSTSSILNTTSTSSTIISSSCTFHPTANLTSAFPMPSKNATSYVPPVPSKVATTPVGVPVPPGPTVTPPVTIPVGSAGSAVFFQSGLMLGLLGAGVAILA